MSKLLIDISRLKTNVRYVVNLCKEKRRGLLGVVKNCGRYGPVLDAIQECGVETLGVSRIKDYEAMAPNFKSRPCYIAVAGAERLPKIPEIFGTSHHSELPTIRNLAQILEQKKISHKIILMVDAGDLREGFSMEELPEAVDCVNKMQSQYLHLEGIGINFGCCSGYLPDKQVFQRIQALVEDVERRCRCRLNTVSVGGCVVLDWLSRDEIPERINHIRTGETFFFGNIPFFNRPIENLDRNVLTFKAEVVEIKRKKVEKKGKLWVDAFGREQECIFQGMRKRAILNFGEMDTEPSGLAPQFDRMILVNSNSDCSIFDITDCEQKLQVGQEVEFSMNYISMARAFLSPYVEMMTVNGKQV